MVFKAFHNLLLLMYLGLSLTFEFYGILIKITFSSLDLSFFPPPTWPFLMLFFWLKHSSSVGSPLFWWLSFHDTSAYFLKVPHHLLFNSKNVLKLVLDKFVIVLEIIGNKWDVLSPELYILRNKVYKFSPCKEKCVLYKEAQMCIDKNVFLTISFIKS